MTLPVSSIVKSARKAISTALVLALIVDPVNASGLRAVNRPLPHSSIASDVFQTSALTERLAAALWRPSVLQTVKTFGVLTLALSLLSGTVYGQKKMREEKPKRPPVQRVELPNAPELERINRLLTDSQVRDAVRRSLGSAVRDGRWENQLDMVEGHPTIFQRYLDQREALQTQLAVMLNQGKYTTLMSDQIRGLGAVLQGSDLSLGQAVAFPGVAAADPKRRVQTSEPNTPESSDEKGFLYWRVLGRTALRVMERAFTGVQVYSGNQVDRAFLQEHEKAFEARRAFTRIQQSLFDLRRENARAWSAYVRQAVQLPVLRDEAWMCQRAYDIERRAGARENRDTETLQRLEPRVLEAVNQWSAAHDALESPRLSWLRSWADSEETFSEYARQSLHPSIPMVVVTEDLLNRAETVAAVLIAERAPLRSSERLLPMPTVEVHQQLSGYSVPLAPADFLSTNESDRVTDFSIPESDWAAVFSPAIDPELGKSAWQDELELQKELLEQVRIPLLQIQKERTWKAGVHFDLGTAPFLASLLNFDLKNPSRSTQFSLDELILAIRLQQGSLDQEIRKEQIRLREAFDQARIERQRALSELIRIRNQYVQYTQQEAAAAESRFPADRNTPALERERSKKLYAAQLVQAWLAWKQMTLYTEGQRAVQERAGSLHQRILNRLNELTGSIPFAGGKLRWVFPALVTLLGVMLPSLGQAYTFSAPTAAARVATHLTRLPSPGTTVAQVAMQVTFDKHDTFWGISKAVLKALHPDQAKFSNTEIWQTTQELLEQSGVTHPRGIHPGQSFSIGSFDPAVAERLQGHAFTSVLPTPPASAAPPVMPMQIPDVAPAAHAVDVHSTVTHVHSSGGFDLFQGWFQQQDLIYGLVAAVGVILLIVGAAAFMRYWRNRKTPQPASGPFARMPLWAIAPVVFFAFSFQGLQFPTSLTLNMPAWFVGVQWMKAVAVLLGASALLSKRLDLTRTPLLKYGLPIGLSALIGMILSPLPGLVFIPLVASIWLMFQIMLWSETDAAYDVLGRVGRDRRTLLLAGLLSLPFLSSLQRRVFEPVREKTTEVAQNIVNMNMLATNYGVGLHEVRLPVTWSPPPHEGGIVSRVNGSQRHVSQGRPVVAYEPLSDSVLKRITTMSEQLHRVHQGEIISPDLLRQAAAHMPALITLQGEITEGSVDGRILDTLLSLEKLWNSYRLNALRSLQQTRATGEEVTSFDQEEILYRLLERGRHLEALLMERQERTLIASRSFDVFEGAGLIPQNTPLQPGSPQVLFTQELSEFRILNVGFTPVDALALENQWHQAPDDSFMRLRIPGRGELDIPLNQIQEVLQVNDPTFQEAQRTEDFFGAQRTNPAVGLDPIVPVSFILPQAVLGAIVPGQVEFLGLYQNGERVTVDLGNRTIGSASIYDKAPTFPRHRFRLRPLQVQRGAWDALLQDFARLREKLEQHQREFAAEGRAWATLRLAELENQVQEWERQRDAVDDEIRRINSTGVAITSNVQAVNTFRHKYYPLRGELAAPREEESVIVLGDEVVVRVSFYATANTLNRGESVPVHVSSDPQALDFEIVDNRPLTAREDLHLFVAERRMALSEARKLFPAGRPLTRSLVQVQLRTSASPLDWLRGRLRLASSVRNRTISSQEPARLLWTEVRRATMNVLMILPVALMVNSFWTIPGLTLQGSLPAMFAGFVGAVLGHEFLGHGWMFVQQRIAALPHLTAQGIEWKGRSRFGDWRPVADARIRQAGPWMSEMLVRISVIGLVLQNLTGWIGVHPVALLAVLVASLVFREADMRPRPAPFTSGDSNAIADEMTFQRSRSGVRSPKQPQPRLHTKSYLTLGQMNEYYAALKNGPLEEERFWYPGDSTESLTWSQRWTRAFRTRIKYTDATMLYEKYKRSGVSYLQAWLLDLRYSLDEKEATASAKTRTYIVVWGIMAFLISLPFWVPATILQSLVQGVTNSSILGGVVNSLISHPDYGFLPILIVIFFAGWVLGGGAEFWGKFFATGWWIARFLPFAIPYYIWGPHRKFLWTTRQDPFKAWQAIRHAQISYRNPDEESTYHQFLDNFAAIAREAAQRAHQNLHFTFRDGMEVERGPQHELAMAFQVAFRIQLRRSRASRLPIYPRVAPEMSSDATLLTHLRHTHSDFDQKPEADQYQLLQVARNEEAMRLMVLFPEHALWAMVRAGIAERLIDTAALEPERRVALEAILRALRERAHSLDRDVFGDVRAQERFDHFFELHHYVFDALRKAVNDRDDARRDAILRTLEPIADNSEWSTWIQVMEQKLETLMSEEGKTADQVIEDQGNLSVIQYTLEQRMTKENEVDTQQWLRELKRVEPHTAEDIAQDLFLRGYNPEKQTYGPTTSALQLNMAYDEHYDLLRQFVDRFPGVAVLGDRNIYLTCENTTNFRQLQRELNYWLKLTQGKIVIMDVGGTHPKFFRFLRSNIRKRLAWKNMHRVEFRTVQFLDESDVLLKDPQALIIASSTPSDYLILKKVAGTLVIVPSELFSTAAMVDSVNALAGDTLRALFREKRQVIEEKIEAQRNRVRELEAHRDQILPELDEGNISFVTHQPQGGRVTRFMEKMLGEGVPLQKKDAEIGRLRKERDRRLATQRLLQRQLDELNHMEHGFRNVPFFLNSIGLETGDYAVDDGHLPVVRIENVASGKYKLMYLIRRSQSPAGPSSTPPHRRALASA